MSNFRSRENLQSSVIRRAENVGILSVGVRLD